MLAGRLTAGVDLLHIAMGRGLPVTLACLVVPAAAMTRRVRHA